MITGALRQLYLFLFSLDEEGLILPGGDEPEPGTVEVPFMSQEEIDKSMSALRWQFIENKVRDVLGLEGE